MKIKGSTLRIKIVKCVGALKMKTCIESLQKKNNGPSFQNSQLLNWSLPTEEFSQVQGQNWPVANLLVIDFRSQPRDMPSLKQVTVCKRYGFFSVLAAIVRKIPKGERRVSSWLAISNVRKKISFFFFHVYCHSFPKGWKILVEYRSLCDKMKNLISFCDLVANSHENRQNVR